MGASSSFSFLLLSILLVLQSPVFALKKPYLIYFGGHSHGLEASLIDQQRVADSHQSFLSSYLGSSLKAEQAIIYSYTKHINGFAASLDDEEANRIRQNPDVISIFPSQSRRLHTTRSWAFMHLERDGTVPAKSIWSNARYGEDAIIANFDTGVWPESKSFHDEGMGPVPDKWKGICESDATGAHCNRKLIGMRAYSKGFEAAHGPLRASDRVPRDRNGHGSHTLSTAGGSPVTNASIFGFANGTAKGGSPRSRVASYKVCWPTPDGKGDCDDTDIVAAFDQAIHDGVDVISLSLGGDPIDYFEDGISIGSFHAVKHGIVVVCSGGNDGPKPGSVTNLAPWIITVGASTLDRSFVSLVKLGNHKQLQGHGLYSGHDMHQKYHPLINSVDAKLHSANITAARLCFVGALDPKKVKGKVVACLRGLNARLDKSLAVHLAGGVGMILANDRADGDSLDDDTHFLPTSHITYEDGLALYAYIKSSKSPVAYLAPIGLPSGSKPSPVMAEFSSQGPNTLTPHILKPDITAPGVHILAAYSEAVSPTGVPLDKRRVAYNILSGTSMSCPHVSGVVGLLKTLHPDWSPAAIRSAIMTTARTRDNTQEPIKNSSLSKPATPFSYGAGHIRPNSAQDPGLVYDLSTEDYLNFLCKLGYNSSQMAAFSEEYKCPQKSSILDLNYPSITVPDLAKPTTITRSLKNVGSPGKYKVRLRRPRGVSVTVKPKKLKFHNVGEVKSYKVTLAPEYGKIGGGSVFGRITWSDGVHSVSSPIVVS